MDNEEAQRRLVRGATLLVLDAPKNFVIGIDGVAWIVGPLFKGIKMIPPRLHFVTFQLCDENHNEVGMPIGWFWWAHPREFVACRWDRASETVHFLSAAQDQDELGRLESNLFNIDRFLGPYPYEGVTLDQTRSFQGHLRHVNESLIERVAPVRTLLSAVSSVNPLSLDKSVRELHFTPLPTEKELVRMNPHYLQDRTEAIRKLNLDYWRLLGEVEVCFVLLTALHNFEAFEHWRNAVSCLCQCAELVKSEADFYSSFCSTLAGQAMELPVDLFEADLTGARGTNKLLRWLQILYDDCRLVSNHPKLLTSCRWLAAVAKQRFGWTLSELEQHDDEAPTIVEL